MNAEHTPNRLDPNIESSGINDVVVSYRSQAQELDKAISIFTQNKPILGQGNSLGSLWKHTSIIKAIVENGGGGKVYN